MAPKKMTPQPKRSGSWNWAAAVITLFLGYLVFRPSPLPALKSPAPLDPTWTQMVTAINEVAERYDGNVGIYIKNLKTGDVYERDADEPFITASLIKVPLMAATFQAIHEGRLSLESSILLRNRHRRDGSGTMKWARAGQRFKVSRILYEMMTRSDNTAAQMFIDLFGYDYLNLSFEKFGLSVTRINPTGMSLADRVNEKFDNYTTAREMGLLFQRMYERDLVSDGYSDLMLEIMKRAEGPSRLAKFLPRNWDLARKSGLLRKNCHDCGIVFTPKGDYIICVLTGNNTNYKKAKGLIADIGHKAYDYIGRS